MIALDREKNPPIERLGKALARVADDAAPEEPE
jgi:hypothetical protein